MARILIVDDSNLARRTTRKILEGAGHEVSEAQDGFSALELYFTVKPALVLLDVTMREMDGIEVLKRIREMDPRAVVVIATADVQASTRAMAKEGGAAGFVVKPIVAPELLNIVDASLQRAESCN